MSTEHIRQHVLAIRNIQDNPDAIRFCEHFLEAAQEFKTVRWALSKELAKFSCCESQLCFENCQRMANNILGSRYFEGFIAIGSMVTEHAWLIDETGEIIDPTLVLHPRVKKRLNGYMGVHIPTDYINDLFIKDPRFDTRIEEAFVDGQW